MSRPEKSYNEPSPIQNVADNKASEDYKTNQYFFPTDDIDPKLKKGQWCRQYAESIWSLFLRGGCSTNFGMINKIRTLRSYGAGAQPREIYMDWLLDSDNMNDPLQEGYLSTNWEIMSPMPFYKRFILAKLERNQLDYVATAVDPTSVDEREEEVWQSWYDSTFGATEAKIKALANIPQSSEVKYIAASMEELEMFKEMGGFKLKKESQIEECLEFTDYISDNKTLKRKVLTDGIDIGRMAFRDYYDTVTGLVKEEYVDWENLVIDHSNETGFKDIRFWGYLKFKTITEVRACTGLTESQIISFIKPYLGWFGNMGATQFNSYANNGFQDVNGNVIYNQIRVPVFICEWLSTDTEYKTMKNGVSYPQDYGKVYDTEKKKTKISTATNVYGCEWIIGSDFVYNDGKPLNIARPNPKQPQLSIHAIALPGKSIVESVVTNLDQVQLTNVKMQSALALAKPQGLSIEVGTLENIDLGDGVMKPLEIIKLARQTGDVVYRATTHAGNYNNAGKPIDISLGGLGPILTEFITLFEMNFRFIAQLSGIDRLSTLNVRAGEDTATGAKLAVQETEEAIDILYSSYIQIKEDGARSVAFKIQRAIKHKPKAFEAYRDIIGNIGLKIMEMKGDTQPALYGVKIEMKPTQEMKQLASQAASEALKPGKDGENISLQDWLFIMDLIRRGRIKQAQAILGYRLNIKREQAIKLQQDNMKMNTETALATEQEKMKSEAMRIQLQEQADIKVEAAKALFAMETSNNQVLNDLKSQMILQALSPQPTGAQPAA